jgi:hypothetical protein
MPFFRREYPRSAVESEPAESDMGIRRITDKRKARGENAHDILLYTDYRDKTEKTARRNYDESGLRYDDIRAFDSLDEAVADFQNRVRASDEKVSVNPDPEWYRGSPFNGVVQYKSGGSPRK